ncbi:kynureninase-like isoform X1 [Haemaphysalis longicornis]
MPSFPPFKLDLGWYTLSHSGVTGFILFVYVQLEYHKSLICFAGADREEITFMNALTVNLHLLMMTYYRPQGKRCKMVIEDDAFSSDMYAAQSQVSHHGLDVASNLIVLKPRKGEFLLREEDICELLVEEGDTIALLLLGGVQLYTGQALDVRRITSAARKKGCVVLWDLAHCVGNTELRLNEWEVDLAAWCTYKYMNCGPGCMGVAYVRHKFREERGRLPELRGWGGNSIKTRHLQRPDFEPSQSADVFKLSNAPPFHVAPIMASLEVFGEIREADRLRKQFLLTGYLELLLMDELGASHDHEDSACPFHILTPADAARRGSQISLHVTHDPQSTCKELLRRGIVCDSRPPSVIRLTPVPLYNTFKDVYNCVRVLRNVCAGLPAKETSPRNG